MSMNSRNGGKKKLSGAQRRKRERQKEVAESELLKKVPKLSAYFIAPQASCSVTLEQREEGQGITNKDIRQPEDDKKNASTHSESDDALNEHNVPKHEAQLPESSASTELLPPSADRAYFGSKTLSAFEKRFVVMGGALQPPGPFPKQAEGLNKGRSFQEHFYTCKTKSGLSFRRTWLSYSTAGDKCYCIPCWLFASPIRTGDSWTDGTCNWKNLSRSIQIHENSATHAKACQIFTIWKNNVTVDVLTDKQIMQDRKYWRCALDRIVNLIITMSKCNIAFRGHRENDSYTNDDRPSSRGCFLEFIHLIAKYDPVLENLLKQPKGTTKYLSGSIQNEIIYILAREVKQQIIDEMADAPFVSLILDTTVDCSKMDQLSKIFRYVTVKKNDEGRPVSLHIQESFLGFTDVESQKGQDLASVITKEIESVTDLKKIRGQGYDGAANMSGAYKGVQSLMKQKAPKARYVHCSAHALNLVINDAVKNVKDIRNFFDMLEKLYVFLRAISRWNRLQKDSSCCSITLKQLCPTRWSSRNQALIALRSQFVDVMKLLTVLSLTGKDSNEKGEASSLKKYFERFSSMMNIVLLSRILGPLDIISKKMQSQQSDVTSVCVLLESLLKDLSELRNNWETVLFSAKELAQSWGMPSEFDSSERVSRVKKFHDELSNDCRLESAEQCYKVEVFNRIIDYAIVQITTRFKSLRDTDQFFTCLKPMTITETNDDELLKMSKSLITEYSDDISDELSDQLLLLKMTFSVTLSALKSIKDLAEFILITHSESSSSFPDIITACLLYLTLPVTVASAERSFSKLKLIKTFLRSTMSEVQLGSLAILSIESRRLEDVDTDKIIDSFADNKACKKSF